MGASEKSLRSHDGSDPKAHHDAAEPDNATWEPEFEKKLVRKIDFSLIPALWVMSAMSFMDRANLGNASIAGLLADLRLSSNQFSLAIITFYFGYIVFVPISQIVLSRTRPSIWLPTIMLLWGAVTCGFAGVKTYPQLIGLRLLMGCFEAGFTSGVTFVFSCWYRPDELGKRASLFITSSLLGGAFGGLIAGGVMDHLEGARGLRGWRWLFLVEGCVTITISLIAVFVLPDYPATCRRLTPEQRTVAVNRLRNVGIIVNDDKDKRQKIGILDSVIWALKDWRTYAITIAATFVSSTLLMAYFYPVLVKGLGYTNPVKAQYMTVPIWAVGFVFTVVSGFATDRIAPYRAWVVSGCLGLLTVMAIITCAVYNFTARYVFLALMTGGVWGGFSQATAYIAELFQDMPPEVRAITMGLMSMAANTGNIYGAYLWPAEQAPKYLIGFGMVAATGGVSTAIFMFIWWMDRRRKRQAAGQGPES